MAKRISGKCDECDELYLLFLIRSKKQREKERERG